MADQVKVQSFALLCRAEIEIFCWNFQVEFKEAVLLTVSVAANVSSYKRTGVHCLGVSLDISVPHIL
jgi:hypothetical protein